MDSKALAEAIILLAEIEVMRGANEAYRVAQYPGNHPAYSPEEFYRFVERIGEAREVLSPAPAGEREGK